MAFELLEQQFQEYHIRAGFSRARPDQTHLIQKREGTDLIVDVESDDVLFDVLTDFEVDVELIKGEGFDVDDERTEEDALFELLLVAEDFVVERSEDEELLDVLVLDDFVVEEKSSDVEELF